VLQERGTSELSSDYNFLDGTQDFTRRVRVGYSREVAVEDTFSGGMAFLYRTETVAQKSCNAVHRICPFITRDVILKSHTHLEFGGQDVAFVEEEDDLRLGEELGRVDHLPE